MEPRPYSTLNEATLAASLLDTQNRDNSLFPTATEPVSVSVLSSPRWPGSSVHRSPLSACGGELRWGSDAGPI